MSVPHAIKALRRLYALRLGELRQGAHLSRPAAELAQIRAVILMIAPRTDLRTIAPIRPRQRRRTGHGSVWVKAALDTLRTADAPLSAHDIATRIMGAQGLPYAPATARNIRTAVRIALQRREGVIVQREPGSPMRWTLANF